MRAASADGRRRRRLAGARPSRAHEPTLAGIDVLAAENFARLRGKRVGLLTNQTGRSRDGVSTIDLLAQAPGVTLAALFSPEHGIRGDADDTVESSRDEKTGLPIHSLYGETLRPDRRRCSTASTSSSSICRTSARASTRTRRRSPTAWRKRRSASCRSSCSIARTRSTASTSKGRRRTPGGNRYVGYLPMPMRHGLTIGELARLFNGEAAHRRGSDRGADEELAARRLVRRHRPRLGEPVAEHAQPGRGVACIRASARSRGPNISVGRGTDTPFEQLGAPWIDGPALAAALNASALPGIRFYPVTFTPARDAKLGGQACHGVFLIVTDRDRLRPVRVGLQIASTLSKLYGAQFTLEDAATLFGPKAMLEKIRAGEDPAAIAASWAADEATWRLTRAKYLLY